ncbi:LOW QUALITY PROTEIN: hypothetical protein CRUP_013599 [Coryphaenoides rupestris]|nr:LOW QUALITY PROTEIN: hypothetical protein CRUP_013599 [Coryphaenoides rupestris]
MLREFSTKESKIADLKFELLHVVAKKHRIAACLHFIKEAKVSDIAAAVGAEQHRLELVAPQDLLRHVGRAALAGGGGGLHGGIEGHQELKVSGEQILGCQARQGAALVQHVVEGQREDEEGAFPAGVHKLMLLWCTSVFSPSCVSLGCSSLPVSWHCTSRLFLMLATRTMMHSLPSRRHTTAERLNLMVSARFLGRASFAKNAPVTKISARPVITSWATRVKMARGHSSEM